MVLFYSKSPYHSQHAPDIDDHADFFLRRNPTTKETMPTNITSSMNNITIAKKNPIENNESIWHLILM